jgi:protoporphyrinogen oxidase
MRILILGAGPTGLGAAHRLHELGHRDWALAEREDHFGGLADSVRDDHGFTWDFAVHVAHSHYHYVDALMDRLLPGGFLHHQRKSWVHEHGVFVPYPFQNNIRHLPGPVRWECVEGLLDRASSAPAPPPEHFEAWIRRGFGDGIARHFLLPYNRKIWSTEPSAMGYQWIGDRVPTIDLQRILRHLTLEQDDVSWGPNATFQFPRQGGTGAIWQALGSRLPGEKIGLRRTAESIDPAARTVRFSDGSVEGYDWLISTLPLPVLARLAGRADWQALTARLRHTHVQVAGVALERPLPPALADKTWLYCPEPDQVYYRVTPFSLFSPHHVPHPDRQCSLLCEISTPGDGPLLPWPDLERRVLNDLRRSGLVEFTDAQARVFRREAEYGYPVPTLERDSVLSELMPRLEEAHILSRGRFGGWKYEVANMDHSLMQGVEAVDRLLQGQPEITWPSPAVVNAGKR